MKVIVVRDDDGHCTVIDCTADNLRKCLQYLLEKHFDFDDREAALTLSTDENATADQLLDFMQDGNAPLERSNGCRMYIQDVEATWHFAYGPWDF